MLKIALMKVAILIAGTPLLSVIGYVMAVVYNSHVYKISIYHGHMTKWNRRNSTGIVHGKRTNSLYILIKQYNIRS
jgi:hypothetical protein